MTSDMETINDLDEAKLLGYFETIRSTFTLKVALLAALRDNSKATECFHEVLLKAAEEVVKHTGEPMTVKAIRMRKEELILNFQEDIVSSAILQAWSVFEQIMKDLPKPNYAVDPDDYDANFERAIFGFSKAEKKDLNLFYYLRNAAMHYNGAYYAYREINHVYKGRHFNSNGHWGEKIEISIQDAYSMITDLQRYAMKAWTAVKTARPKRSK